MEVENGMFLMKGLAWDDPYRIRTPEALEDWIEEVGFLPFFANEVPGFSVEEHVCPDCWWTGDPAQDPWEWRELLAERHRVAYGKFFHKKAGFISQRWLPYFANCRRDGYDFDSAWEDGRLDLRAKRILDVLTETDADGEIVWKTDRIRSTDLKQIAGFGKGGEKNYPGITTDLMMKLYLVTAGFSRRQSKKGVPYGMAVSILLPPEAVWGYDALTSAYHEAPSASWQRIFDRVKAQFPADDDRILAVIGKKPTDD